MNRKTSKRRQLVMRTFVYSLMTLSVVAIVSVLMLIILGYSFNRQDGRLEQGGLLQFASTPNNATVTLDGLQLGSRTPSKANVDASSHHVQMSLAGYRPWNKTIVVQAGGIGWLNYARMVPTDIKTESMRTFPKLAASLATQDRKWIAAQEDGSINKFLFINIESDTPKYTELAIPEAILTPASVVGSPQSFTVASWSSNNDRLLIKRTYDETKTEWIVFDRENPERSLNMTSTFAIGATDVQFGERNGSTAYILSDDGIVRKVSFDNSTLSGALADNVSEFSTYDTDTIVYVSRPDEKETSQRHVGYRQDGMSKAQTIFSYPASTENLHASIGSYYGKTYVAVTHGLTMEAYTGALPKSTAKTETELARLARVSLKSAPIRLTVGNSGRMVTAQMADGYATYDIETAKTDTTSFTRPAAVQRPLQWIDAYLIANDRGGILRLYEFDGANQQDIMPVVEGQAVSLTGNDKFLYGFSAHQDGVALTRARMTTR